MHHVRYLSNLALQVGSSNWVHKTRIHSIQRWHHFGIKLANPLFPSERRLHPFNYWIKYSWSKLTHILYYINLSVRWNIIFRDQISSCQCVFYRWDDMWWYQILTLWYHNSKVPRNHLACLVLIAIIWYHQYIKYYCQYNTSLIVVSSQYRTDGFVSVRYHHDTDSQSCINESREDINWFRREEKKNYFVLCTQ
jgi:hypothetical protein